MATVPTQAVPWAVIATPLPDACPGPPSGPMTATSQQWRQQYLNEIAQPLIDVRELRRLAYKGVCDAPPPSPRPAVLAMSLRTFLGSAMYVTPECHSYDVCHVRCWGWGQGLI